MDILTQGLLGGVLAQAVAGRQEKKSATLAGLFAGLLADVDVLIGSASDPLLNIEYHRHFTHSLVFIPFGAAIACLLLWPLLRRRVSPARLYLFCLAGYSMSGVLDACTSYGTHLFWPFTDVRIAFNIISIIDPVFTLILLLTLIVGLRLPQRRIAPLGLSLCVMYLALGFVQLQRAEALALELRESRGHVAERFVVKPTLGNLLLWRSVYIHAGRIHVDAVRLGLFGGNTVYEGESLAQFVLPGDLPQLDETTTLHGDIRRFLEFSDGYVAIDPTRQNVLGDIRYSMLPASARPLWGIVIDRSNPDRHADYQFFRQRDADTRRTFMNMLFGRCSTTQACADS